MRAPTLAPSSLFTFDREVWGYCRYALRCAKDGNTPESDLVAVITRLDDVPQSTHRYEHLRKVVIKGVGMQQSYG